MPTSNTTREINEEMHITGPKITNISISNVQNCVDEGTFQTEGNALKIEKYLHGSQKEQSGQFLEVMDSNTVEIVETKLYII